MTKEEILERTGFDLVRAKEVYEWLNEPSTDDPDGKRDAGMDVFLPYLEALRKEFFSELDSLCSTGVHDRMAAERTKGKIDAIDAVIGKLSGEEEASGISESDAFLKHLSLMKRKFAEELSEAERNVSVKGMEYANGELSAVVEAMEWLQRKEDVQ